MSTLKLRVVARLVIVFVFVFALSLTGWASNLNQGSTIVNRSFNDNVAGLVYIYAGGTFANGETVTVFNWFDSEIFTGTSAMTPLLFTSNGEGTYTVVGIGAVENVDSFGAQTAVFGLQAGANLVSGNNWTFGFLEGGATSTGAIDQTTAGGIPYNSPIDGPPGVSGSGTNDWVFTPGSDSITTVALGTTFGANGTFALNNPSLGGFNVNRTYSANANGIISGVAEPGTFSLITGAGLVLAGLFRYRYGRGRRD